MLKEIITSENCFFILPLIFLGITYLLWLWFGRSEKIIPTMEVYPPEGFNSANLGFSFRGRAGKRDVISLLLYLANKGYIKIEIIEEDGLLGPKQEFKIIKMREYDGQDPNIKLFLSGLFSGIGGKKVSLRDKVMYKKSVMQSGEVPSNFGYETQEVKSSELSDSFYLILNTIIANMNNKENKDLIFEKTSPIIKMIPILFVLVTYVLITVIPLGMFGDMELWPIVIFFPGLSAIFVISLIINSENSVLGKILGFVWGFAFGGVPWIAVMLPVLLQDGMYLAGYGLGLLCIMAMVFFYFRIPKRTQYGHGLLGIIEGFKTFIESADSVKLEELTANNSNYFYEILPYAYVLGIHNKWIDKFRTIDVMPPSWYKNDSSFTMIEFKNFINFLMRIAAHVMSFKKSKNRY